MPRIHVPFALWGDEVVKPQLAVDLLETEVDGVVVKLSLRYTAGGDGGGKTWNIDLGIAPTTPTLARIRVYIACEQKKQEREYKDIISSVMQPVQGVG